MSNWKCNNLECLNQWSEKDPAYCPVCASTDFEPTGKSKMDWRKISKIVGGILIFIIIIKICTRDKDVTAEITFSSAAGKLKVDLDSDGLIFYCCWFLILID